MKAYLYSKRSAVILIAASILLIGIPGTSQAGSSDVRSHRVAIRDSVQPQVNGARLIIRRIANLGNRVIVDLSVDGVPVLPIVYGQTYEGFLAPGRHVLSVLATPSPKWPDPSDLILNVRTGETYSFTAMGDGAGRLILKGS
jgi:hypothetical protein